MGKEADFSKMTDDDFDRHLLGVMECMTMVQILELPGIYKVVSEELNNDVLAAWEDEAMT